MPRGSVEPEGLEPEGRPEFPLNGRLELINSG